MVVLLSKLHIDTYARPHAEYRLTCLYRLENELEGQRTRVFTETALLSSDENLEPPWQGRQGGSQALPHVLQECCLHVLFQGGIAANACDRLALQNRM